METMIAELARLNGNYFIAFFPDRVSFTQSIRPSIISRERPKSREGAMFIRLPTSSHLSRSRGAVIALDSVGQRDTKWLVPLTVSGGYQGEEGNHTY